MKTDNELIAEFMGIVFWKQIQGQKYYKVPKEHVYVNNANLGQFRYDKSWDWLMPVVEKIESNDRTLVVIYSDVTKIWVDDFEGIELFATTQHGNKDNKIDHVRRACLEYINWHNSQPK